MHRLSRASSNQDIPMDSMLASAQSVASIAMSEGDEAVQHAGWLKKQGQDLFASWKTRWFCQQGQQLHYYVGEDKKKYKGTINLARATAVGPSLKHVRQGEWIFHISTNERLYALEAPSKNEMEAWCASIDDVLDHSGNAQPVSPLLQSLIDGGLAPAISFESTSLHHRRQSNPINTPQRTPMGVAGSAPGSGSDHSPNQTPPVAPGLEEIDDGTIDFINSVFNLQGMTISDPPEAEPEAPNPAKRARGGPSNSRS